MGRGSEDSPPEELDAAIIFAPVGALVPAALRVLAKGAHPKTTPEVFKADLDIFGMIMDALKHEKLQTGQEVH